MKAKGNAKGTAGVRVVSPDLENQRQYTRKMLESGFDFSLVVADAFVRGIRDIGYRHTGTAVDELIDNAIQAEAEAVHVIFGFESGSEKKPDRLAVIDNGHGMDPEMIQFSVVWGGTHRENDRSGFGRYGYGLPSASVSQGRRFTVYSRPADGKWHKVTLDLDQISAGEYTNKEGRIVVPPPSPATLPEWLEDYLKEHFGRDGLEHGTIVEIEKLDRLSWKTATNLERKVLEHFGVTYRNFLREVEIRVNGKQVEPCDPLFLTSGFRYYDLDEDRAEALPPITIEVKGRNGVVHLIKGRFSYMPPTFQRKDKSNPKGGRENMNARFGVMKDYNGIIVLRNGRQIDVLTTCDWTTFLTYDRNWGVEIDFPAGLDEEFSITTSKQHVRLSERLWDVLKEAGVYSAIEEMRRRFKRQIAELKGNRDQDPNRKRASEQAMEEAAKYKTRKPGGDPEERRTQAEEELQREIQRRAKLAGILPQNIEGELRAEVQGRPYKVMIETLPGAPFFRMAQIGGQKVLYLNTEHRFYTDVYAGPDSTPRLRASLEVLLFVLGESELDSTGERQLFYLTERAEWSNRLNVALNRLEEIEADEGEVAEEETEATSTAVAGEAGATQ
jgi:hypothetical protein